MYIPFNTWVCLFLIHTFLTFCSFYLSLSKYDQYGLASFETPHQESRKYYSGRYFNQTDLYILLGRRRRFCEIQAKLIFTYVDGNILCTMLVRVLYIRVVCPWAVIRNGRLCRYAGDEGKSEQGKGGEMRNSTQVSGIRDQKIFPLIFKPESRINFNLAF